MVTATVTDSTSVYLETYGGCKMPYRICKLLEVESGHMLTKHPDNCRSQKPVLQDQLQLAVAVDDTRVVPGQTISIAAQLTDFDSPEAQSVRFRIESQPWSDVTPPEKDSNLLTLATHHAPPACSPMLASTRHTRGRATLSFNSGALWEMISAINVGLSETTSQRVVVPSSNGKTSR